MHLAPPAALRQGNQRAVVDYLQGLNRAHAELRHDSELDARIASYELAYRMQAAAPEAVDLTKEPTSTRTLYGPGFGEQCLTARRLIERGVRFVQIYHNNWDHHGNLAGRMPDQCRDVDRPCYGLIQDLKQRGMLDDTLIIWGGEFGRTIYSQGGLSHENYGRDHHPRCFSMWMAGGGTKGGTVFGETDDFAYNIVADPVPVHDLHATILNLLGFDHRKLSYKYQGLDGRLTGVEEAHVVKALLA
jgi:uncharacterized protein (DUF1501 family)